MTSFPFAFLLLIIVIVPTISAQGGISTCCLKFTGTKIRRELLLSYYQEDKSYCRLQAVIFTTVNGKRICANPVSAWAKISMAFLDGKPFKRPSHSSKDTPCHPQPCVNINQDDQSGSRDTQQSPEKDSPQSPEKDSPQSPEKDSQQSLKRESGWKNSQQSWEEKPARILTMCLQKPEQSILLEQMVSED